MFPITLDLRRLSVVLAGNGPSTVRRLGLLRQASPRELRLFAPDAPAELQGAGPAPRWPEAADLAGAQVMFIADLPLAQASALAATGRRAGLLVNVEDAPAECDFHSPAIVRRGDLLVAISTGGKSPGLARELRVWLDGLLDAGWGERLDQAAALRERLRAQGAGMEDVANATRDFLAGFTGGSERQDNVGNGSQD